MKERLAAQSSAVTLAHIASMEKKVSEHFHVKDFQSLEKGSFLEFLLKNIQVPSSFLILQLVGVTSDAEAAAVMSYTVSIPVVQLLQDTVGSTLILGSSSSVGRAGSGFRPSIQDVFEFIKQCGDVTSTDPDEVRHKHTHKSPFWLIKNSRCSKTTCFPALSHRVGAEVPLRGPGQSRLGPRLSAQAG